MTGAVVDASVALKWVVEEAGSAEATRLLDGRPLYAPSLILVEAANALWAMQRRGTITGDDGAAALAHLAAAPWRLVPEEGARVGQAYRLARLLGHPVYDCVYLALALEVGAPVVTADRRLVAAARGDADLGALVVPLDAVAG